MKIILISDTHNRHDDVVLPAGDMLIHAGDISGRGRINPNYALKVLLRVQIAAKQGATLGFLI